MHATSAEKARKPVGEQSAENVKLTHQVLRQLEQLRDTVTGPMPAPTAPQAEVRREPAGLAAQQDELGQLLLMIIDRQAMLLGELGGAGTTR